MCPPPAGLCRARQGQAPGLPAVPDPRGRRGLRDPGQARRAVARSVMRSTLEAGGAAPQAARRNRETAAAKPPSSGLPFTRPLARGSAPRRPGPSWRRPSAAAGCCSPRSNLRPACAARKPRLIRSGVPWCPAGPGRAGWWPLRLFPGRGQAQLAHRLRDGVLADRPARLLQIGGDPRRPALALMRPEQARDLALSRSRRAACGGSVPADHLQNQDGDTPAPGTLPRAGYRAGPSGRR